MKFSPLILIALLTFCLGSSSAQQAPNNLGQTGQITGAASQFNRTMPSLQEIAVQNNQVASRIKDITSIGGHGTNLLTGFGLVTGLKGTGSTGIETQQMAINYYRNNGIRLDGRAVKTANMAAVTVTAEVPAFLNPGEKFDVIVSMLGDGKSLYNGNLSITNLVGFDDNAYAVAMGPITMGGFSAGGDAGGVQKNHDTVGVATATLQEPMSDHLAYPNNSFLLQLINKDNATAVRIARAINILGPGIARPLNAGTVEVFFPKNYLDSKIEFAALIGELRVTPDTTAKVVINQKTGTIVVGHNVKLSPTMFSISNLVITTTETPIVSQPAPLSGGQTAIVPRTQIDAREIHSRYNMLDANPTIGDLARALNTLGVTPSDLVSVFRALKRSGSLQAELVVQ